MSTLLEIEDAAQRLSVEEQQKLVFRLIRTLRAKSVPMPSPRQFSAEQMRAWIIEDEQDLRHFRHSA